MSRIPRAVLDKLRTFDTPTICNIIELFEVRAHHSGYMDARIKACFPEMPPMVGFAATATFRASAPPREGDAYASLETQIERFEELCQPPIVVFQDLDDPSVAATFGEVMCTAYQAFDAVGLITSGTGRDLEQVRALNFPVFTNGSICSHGYNHFPQIHVPVRVGGVVVNPNDLLHGDLNGVTTIPHAIATEVADIGDEFVAAEGIILGAMRSPAHAGRSPAHAGRSPAHAGRGKIPSIKELRDSRAEARAIMQKLRARVSRARGA
jgi:regulator of RNase E activity RraA